MLRRSEAFPPEPASAGSARRLVTRALEEWEVDDLADTCSLLVSELVTNALLHAASDVLVQIDLGKDLVRIGVADRSSVVPVRRQYGTDATTGRGLELVEALATRWGIDVGPEGKTAWFELSLDGSSGRDDPDVVVTPPEPIDPEEAPCTARFEQLPVALTWATVQHGDALVREAALLALASEPAVGEPSRWQAPQLDLTPLLEPVKRSLDKGIAVLDLELGFPRRAAHDALQRLALIEEANRLAEEGLLLAPALPEVAACRRWLLGEIVRQLGGEVPTPWRLPDEQAAARGGRSLGATDMRVLEGITSAAIAADDTNYIVFVNERAATLLGWTVGELTGQRLTVIVPPDLREAHLAGFTRYQLTGEDRLLGRPVHVPALGKDGSLVEVELLIDELASHPGLFVATLRPAS